MKIIVHMGQGKTGTTALQKSLHAASGMLRAHGILYAQFGTGFDAHHLLMALLGKVNLLPPPTLVRLGGPEAAVETARAAWKVTCDDVWRSAPDLLVLSSEYLFHWTDRREKAHLVALLSELSTDITPVIYVRHPVDHFRARLQQGLKSSDFHFSREGPDLKAATLDTEATFAQRPQLVAFDRRALHGGDIVEDFATRFLAPLVSAADLPRFQSNVGLSAEALMLMSRLRAAGDGSYEANRRVARLIPHLEALDQGDPPARPLTLLPQVADAALRTSTGHRWLAETGRLQIPGLDVGKIDGASPPLWMHHAPPEALFAHDPQRLERLRKAPSVAAVIQSLQDPDSEKPDTPKHPGWMPSAHPKPGKRTLLLRFLLRKLALLQDRNTGFKASEAKSARRASQGENNEDH